MEQEPTPDLRDLVTIDDFERIDIRVGRIVAADPFPAARKPAYQLTIDFGPLGVRRSSVQITEVYRLEDLPGKLVLAVVNFPPRRIAGFSSDVLVLGLPNAAGHVVLLAPEWEVPLGRRVF
jgi:tRNA-binding protein